MSTIDQDFEAMFYSDGSEASREAKRLLDESGLPYLEAKKGIDYKEADFVEPVIQGRYGDRRGIVGVRAYIALYQADPRRKL